MAELRAYGEAFRQGRYREAAAGFQLLAAQSVAAREERLAARATGNLGGCLFALHQYQPALQAFLEARRVARAAGDASAIAAFDTNIASLYAEMGDLEAAGTWIEGARDRLSAAADRRDHLPQLLIQLATIRARQQRTPEALALFRQGIDLADRAADVNLYAIGWNRWGEELLKSGNLAEAEPALLEAYRVRKLNHLALDSSYRNLGRLRLEQGDLPAASNLLDRAVELATAAGGPIPTWDLYHYRGRVRLAESRLAEALADLRNAVRLGRAWRWSAPADDAGRRGAEGWLQQVHAALIQAGNRLYAENGGADYIRETFEAMEENRASSLRALRSARSGAPPAEYWEALLRLQRAEVQALRAPRGEAKAAAVEARAELDRVESSLARENRDEPDWNGRILERVQTALDSRTALLSFQLGDAESWLWAVDRDGVMLYALPPRAVIASQVEAAARSVSQDLPGAIPASAALCATLFGRLSPRFEQKRHWLLALDDALFDAPLAVLVTRQGTRPVYLVESHVIQVIPGAGWWLEAAVRQGPPLESRFVGVGDPIYNAADERLRSGVAADGTVGAPRLAGAALLPRLVASGPELDTCARAWGAEQILLKGSAASRSNLQNQLRRNPSVVHFATHVLASSERPGDGMIALSRNANGVVQFLGPGEIATWRIRAGVIVLSGCHSAAGRFLPGTGLLGLTRSWLAAGADSVIGSRWDVPDENSALFGAFYRFLRAQPHPRYSQALRDAQLEMLRSGDWRAYPRYWGAYFLTGMEGSE